MSNIDIIGVSPRKITLAYKNPDEFNGELKLGTYIKIPDQETGAKEILGMISNYHIQYIEKKDEEGNDISMKRFVIDVDILGTIEEDLFIRGGHGITIPPHNDVAVASTDDLKKIYIIDDIKKFSFSNLSQDNGVRVNIDGNKFFNKHFAIVGSTGSGKSNTVAKILQTGMEEKNGGFDLNNSHIILFDIHGEYQDCFGNKANKLDITNLILPYRLLNSEELEDLFIDSEANDHNQRNIFKEYIINSKKELFIGDDVVREKIHYDSPYLFDIQNVYQKIKEKDEEMVQGARDLKQGPLFGKLTNFITRLESKLNDRRLDFILGELSKTISFQDAIKQFIGYNSKENITVIDLSGIPSEVLNIVVSLISRLLFQYGYYHKKYLQTQGTEIEIPLVLVFEEAHKYIPKTGGSKYNSVKESIERIAKEGRKYGVTLGIISQRPSEISETIFSQCNNFIAMRLTNPEDQNYIKRLLPDALGDMIEILPLLERGEGLIMGDSINMPSLIKIDECDIKPHSNDVKYIEIWKEEWKEIDFEQLEVTWKG